MWGGPITPALGKQRQGHEESSQFDLLTHTLSPLPTKQLANFLKMQQLAPVAVRSTLLTRAVVPSSTFQSKRAQQTCMLIPSELWRPAPLPYVTSTSLAIRLSYWAECGSPRPMPLTMSSLYQQTQHHLKLCTDATLAYCGLLSLGLRGQGPAMNVSLMLLVMFKVLLMHLQVWCSFQRKAVWIVLVCGSAYIVLAPRCRRWVSALIFRTLLTTPGLLTQR